MKRIDLKGEWTLAKAGNNDKIKAMVPGDTHSALYEAGHIPDPYDRLNELDIQWIGREDWTYARSFEVGTDMLSAKEAAGGAFEVEASASGAPALYFSVNADGIKGEFDSNMIALVPGKAKKFLFTPKEKGLTLKKFKDSLSFRHLRMTCK